jgi:hypothetical protein
MITLNKKDNDRFGFIMKFYTDHFMITHIDRGSPANKTTDRTEKLSMEVGDITEHIAFNVFQEYTINSYTNTEVICELLDTAKTAMFHIKRNIN